MQVVNKQNTIKNTALENGHIAFNLKYAIATEHNLNDIAIDGKVMFVRPANEIFGHTNTSYRVELTNPTYLDIALAANKMIEETGDINHVLLTGFEKLPRQKQNKPGVNKYKFIIQSPHQM